MNGHSFARLLQSIATVGPLLFFAVATIEGLVRAGYDPIEQPISALALGARGWIQQANFALLAISLAAFGVTLRTRLRGGAASLAAPAIFGLMTIGITLAGIFTMDPLGAPATVAISRKLSSLRVLILSRWCRTRGPRCARSWTTASTSTSCRRSSARRVRRASRRK